MAQTRDAVRRWRLKQSACSCGECSFRQVKAEERHTADLTFESTDERPAERQDKATSRRGPRAPDHSGFDISRRSSRDRRTKRSCAPPLEPAEKILDGRPGRDYSLSTHSVTEAVTMARPRSEEKRTAILEAATEVFAAQGFWATPTSAISRAAGIAEGTLFTYFATKDMLLNELYRAIKEDVAEALMLDYPENAPFQGQARHIWNTYIAWGLRQSQPMTVMTQLRMSEAITPATKAASNEPFQRFADAARGALKDGRLIDVPFDFLGALMSTMAETTMAAISERPKLNKQLRDQGFQIFWNGITRSRD